MSRPACGRCPASCVGPDRAVFRLPGQPQGRPREERRPHGLLLHAGCRALFALADGMGGHPEGEVASQLALQTMSAMFQRAAKPRLADPLRFLHDAIIAGHHQLLRYATERALMDTPRTTLVACVLQGNAAYWAHCGDSRLYLVRGDKLVARTRDHSYSELQETLAQVVPMATASTATCSSPAWAARQAGGGHGRAAGGASRRPRDAVLRRPVGRRGRPASSPNCWPATRSPNRCPNWWNWPCVRQAKRATTSPCWPSSGKPPKIWTARAASPRSRWATRFLPPPSRPAWPPRRCGRTGRRRDRAIHPRDQRGHSAQLQEAQVSGLSGVLRIHCT
jgi:hypothetical protein